MNGQRLNVGGVYGYGTEEEWTQEGKTVLLTPHGFDYLKILVLKEKNREEWLSAMLPVPNLSLYSNQDV